MASTAALIVAAGSGIRAGADLPKQYRRIGGKAVLRHAVEALIAHPEVDELQVVIGEGQQALYHEALAGLEPPEPISGGRERSRSVVHGLERVRSERVLIHDAARPFCPAGVVDRLLAALATNDGAVPVLAVADTVGRGAEKLESHVDRTGLFRIQTPQAFRTKAILAAHREWRANEPSDDSQVARAAGLSVAMVEGNPVLDKLTWPGDFARAEAMLAAALVSRTGLGFDVHAFGPGNGLWLGGVRIPHERGLVGHSDADVLLHALTDALLGTLGAGDIGTHFPPGDARWRGADSSVFLEHARAMVEDAGGRIDHVDATLICEAPRLGPYREAMRERVAALLRLPVGRVSIKATTTERLGFTGRGEGIAAQAVASVRLPEDR